jgi:hypothetical protein
MEYTKEDFQEILEWLYRSVENHGWFEIDCDHAEILQSEIERLRSLTRWIPVEEKLPEEGAEVLIYTLGDIYIGYLFHGNFTVDEQYGAVVVTHWMKLPEGVK